MRSRIEQLKLDAASRSIVRRWPHAVLTPEGFVIPEFVRVTEDASLDACVSEEGVALRPRLRGKVGWESQRRQLLEYIECAFDVSLQQENDAIALDEEWGDFTVWCR